MSKYVCTNILATLRLVQVFLTWKENIYLYNNNNLKFFIYLPLKKIGTPSNFFLCQTNFELKSKKKKGFGGNREREETTALPLLLLQSEREI